MYAPHHICITLLHFVPIMPRLFSFMYLCITYFISLWNSLTKPYLGGESILHYILYLFACFSVICLYLVSCCCSVFNYTVFGCTHTILYSFKFGNLCIPRAPCKKTWCGSVQVAATTSHLLLVCAADFILIWPFKYPQLSYMHHVHVYVAPACNRCTHSHL